MYLLPSYGTSRLLADPQASPQVWDRFTRLQRAATEFMNAIPPIEDMRGMDGGDGTFRPAVNPALVAVQTGGLVAAFLLAGLRASSDVNQREKRLNIAMQGAELARRLDDIALVYAQVAVGVCRHDSHHSQ